MFILLVELELETLEESLLGEGVSIVGASLCPSLSTPISPSERTLAPASQPFRLLKVILAFRMWYRGISAERASRDVERHLTAISSRFLFGSRSCGAHRS